MKKLLALLLALFILTLTGCNAADNTSSDIDTNSSEIISSANESPSQAETSSNEASSGTGSEENSSETETSSVEETVLEETNSEVTSTKTETTEKSSEVTSKTETPSKTESSSAPTTSNKVENSSSNQTTSTNKTESKNETSSTTNPTYPTIVLNQKTTYYGYPGYFTLDYSVKSIDLVSMGLATNKSDRASLCPTEYYDVNSDMTIAFIINYEVVYPSNIMNYVNEIGRGTIPVNVVG